MSATNHPGDDSPATQDQPAGAVDNVAHQSDTGSTGTPRRGWFVPLIAIGVMVVVAVVVLHVTGMSGRGAH